MRLLVVGSGGREHALCWALRREGPDADIYCAPGNPGTAEIATNLSMAADDLDRLADAADMHGIDLTVIGPEVPLARGLADRLRAEGRAVFGPSAAAAQLEASKAFAKEVMAAAGIPTASSRTFHELAPAMAYVSAHAEPLVVKASGLAAGKGAIVCDTRAQAEAAVRGMLGDGVFGDAGPNTGGMGAYSPVTVATPELLERTRAEVLLPALAEMRRRGTPFSGVLYAGLMVSDDGTPWVVEFNCRLGDPETQVVLPLVSGGFTRSLWAVARGQAPTALELVPGAASVTTVLASRGYPETPAKGAPITIPARLPDGVTVFHAGTTRDEHGVLRVNGGRVLNVTAVASSFSEAQRLSREAAEAIEFDGKVFRRDIGWREASRLAATAR